MRLQRRWFLIVTGIMCVVMAAGAIFDVAKTDVAVKLIGDLGYPEYFVRFIGVMKLLGIIAIVQPKYKTIKEWAFAGLVFDTGGALFSHFSSQSPAKDWLPALFALLLVSASYVLYRQHEVGTLQSSPDGSR